MLQWSNMQITREVIVFCFHCVTYVIHLVDQNKKGLVKHKRFGYFDVYKNLSHTNIKSPIPDTGISNMIPCLVVYT